MKRFEEKLDNFELSTAEAFNQRLDKLSRSIVDLVAGSDSSAYVQLPWKTATQTVREFQDSSFVRLDGDPQTGHFPLNRIPRRWKRAAVYGAHRAVMYEIFADDPELQPALVYAVGTAVHVGVLPEGREFVPINDDFVGGASRRGNHQSVLSLGGWNARLDHLVLPNRVEAVVESLPNIELPERFPGITLG